MQEAEDRENERRERGVGGQKAGGVIPGPMVRQSSAGAVYSTDSESEAENMHKMEKEKDLVQFKWTPEWEERLEEILMRNYFDFHATAKEFSKLVNGDASSKTWY